MMNLTQYVLSKVAEEATELAKEALKGQQQGLFSDWRGKKNYEFIQDEYVDLIARSAVLDFCDDVIREKGDQFSLLVNRHTLDKALVNKIMAAIDKMCYFAILACEKGQLQLSEREREYVMINSNNYLKTINQNTSEGIPNVE